MTALSEDLRALTLRIGDILADGRDIDPDEVAAAEALAHALDAVLTPDDK